MKTKIKVIALLLCLALIISAATGCGSFTKLKDKLASDTHSADDYTVSQNNEPDVDVEKTEPEEPDVAVADEYKVEIKNNNSAEDLSAGVYVDQQVIYDEEDVKITVLDYAKGQEVYEMTLFIENNTDEELTVYSDAVIVNGFYSNESALYTNVSAGKQRFGFVYFSLSDYEKQCMGKPGEIELYLTARDDDYNYVLNHEYFQIHTSAYPAEVPGMIFPSKELFNKNNVKIDYVDIDTDNSEEYYVYFYVENNSDSELMLLNSEVIINGIKMNSGDSLDALFYGVYPAKSKGLTRMTVFAEAIEQYKIDSIEKIELKFTGVDIKTYKPLVDTETITINPMMNKTNI